MEEVKQKKELLDVHLKEVSKWMENSNIDPASEFGQEFLKQTKELIEQFYEIRELKGRVTALEKQIQEFPEQLMRFKQ